MFRSLGVEHSYLIIMRLHGYRKTLCFRLVQHSRAVISMRERARDKKTFLKNLLSQMYKDYLGSDKYLNDVTQRET